MESSLQNDYKISDKKNKKFSTVTRAYSINNTFSSNINQFSSFNRRYNWKDCASLLEMMKNFFLNPLYSILIEKPPVTHLGFLYNHTRRSRKIGQKKSFKEGKRICKTSDDAFITGVKTLLQTLFSYNCKNTIVQYSEKANLLFRLENKSISSACKMLQTTTI
ncbi:hypothetical protein [Segetibacter koreensis]|uniref:hypothetical protein n=1 Tax=Segetibacter koreensis TaxID=398037 RepID=UPI00037794C3|nr:hypothetical protein [Segetibacter koreensis]